MSRTHPILSRRCVGGLALALGLACLGVVVLRHVTTEPAHDGRRLSEWLEWLDTGPPDKAQHAEEAIRRIGPGAVAFLVNELRTSDRSLRVRALRWANRYSPVELPYRSAGLRQYRALRGFEILGERAATAAPALRRMSQSLDPERHQLAQEALRRIQQIPASAPRE